MTARAQPFQPMLSFDAAETAGERGEALILDLDGFEGPLHLLLALARGQKVDLLQISIAQLAEQYLAFVQGHRQLHFALAAEYLVMAAWLAYLKSRLLLPKPQKQTDDEPSAELLAEALTFRLAKLDAMRGAGEALKRLPQLGRDVFPRGDPEARVVHASAAPLGDIYDLMAAYAGCRTRPAAQRYDPAARAQAYPLEAARARLRDLLPALSDWTALDALVPDPTPPRREDAPRHASYVASTLCAGLEMVRDGTMEARQLQAFATLYLRARPAAAATDREA